MKDEGRTPAEAAVQLGISISTLKRWRHEGRGPLFVKHSPRCIRYMQSELDKYMGQRSVQSTAEGKTKVS